MLALKSQQKKDKNSRRKCRQTLGRKNPKKTDKYEKKKNHEGLNKLYLQIITDIINISTYCQCDMHPAGHIYNKIKILSNLK